MSQVPLRQITLTFVLTLLLSACGGGGGGSSSPPPEPPAPPAPPPNAAPSADFSTSTASGTAPLEVVVDGSASSDSDGSITSFAWDFGDGTEAIGDTAQVTYTEAGSFELSLTVTDDEGAVGTTTRTITVEEPISTSTVSGTVQILSSSAIDSDVNDRFTSAVSASNNDFDNAQPVVNPTTVGGYAAAPGAAETDSGLLDVSGDPADFYAITLSGDEVILLSIAETDADLDLRLWDSDRALVDASMSTELTESLTAPAPGDYFIEVVLVSGATNYVLTVGQDLSTTSNARPLQRLSDPFIPGELVMQTTTPTGFQAAMTYIDGSAGASAPHLYKVNDSTQLLASNQRTTGAALPTYGNMTTDQQAKFHTLNAVRALQSDPRVECAEPNRLLQASLTPNDTFYPRQWNYPIVNLPLAWDVTTGSEDVIIAIVDTGVLLAHPDFSGKLVPGFDFISDAARANDGDGIDPDPNDAGDLSLGGNSSFHGTHVAGTAGAASDNNEGVAGVSWGSRIMPIRVLGVDGGSSFDVIQGVRFAAGLSNNSGTVPSQAADVINLSLGGNFSSQIEQNTYNEVRDAGVIVVAAAGNESSSVPHFPAAYENVVSVAATTITNSRASYSNFGATIDIAAPGGNNTTDINGDGIGDGVISTLGEQSGNNVNFGYAALNGTSMAAPHVAGVVALMKSVHPGLTPQEFDQALVAGELTTDLGAEGRDSSFGFGLIDAQRAVATALQLAAGQGVDPGPVLAASIAQLNFGAFTTSLPITLQNIGTGDIGVTNISGDQPWLSVTPASIDANGLGEYTVRIDRSGLADGVFSGTITVTSDANTVTSDANTVTIGVQMQVSSANLTADAGLHFIILVNADNQTVLPAVGSFVQDGEYPFTITDVPNGQYRLFAGTDSDNDDFLCDAGEACGAFATVFSPDIISVNGDVDGLTFVSSLRLNLSTSSGEDQSTDSQAGFAIDKGQIQASKTPARE